jgi:hypothetical protein
MLMKTILKIAAAVTVLVLILFVELVPQAEAIYGTRRRTRRRTAVVSYSAGAATASAATAAAARSQQEATAARSASAVPVGTIVQALPAGCTAVTVGGTQYQECGGSFYRAAFQGNNLVYVVVEKPI